MLPTTFHTAIGKCRVVHALLARLEILIPANGWKLSDDCWSIHRREELLAEEGGERDREREKRMDVFEKGSNIDYDWIKSMLTRDWMSIARLEKAWRSLRVFHFSDSVRIGADSAARFLSLSFQINFFSLLWKFISVKMDDELRISNRSTFSSSFIVESIYPSEIRSRLGSNEIKIVFSDLEGSPIY